jgi:hypothetical protein
VGLPTAAFGFSPTRLDGHAPVAGPFSFLDPSF